MIRFGIYLTIGAMLHVIFIGSSFDWSSAWTWIWLLGWPILIGLPFAFFALIAVGIIAFFGSA